MQNGNGGTILQRLVMLLVVLSLRATPGTAAEALSAPPTVGLGSLVQQLAQAKPAPATTDKAALLRPEFRFQAQRGWVFLPEMARQLASTDAERAAVRQLLEQGSEQMRHVLAAENADADIVVATTIALAQLWGVARGREVPDAGVDALHAQLVASIPRGTLVSIGKTSDADKQKYWEYCVGLPVFVLGLKEITKNPAGQETLRQFAGTAFRTLFGAGPETIEINADGIRVAAAVAGASPPAPAAPAVTAAGRLRYTPPAGWTREDAAWATIFRATVQDVDTRGQIDNSSRGRHAASLFVLPPRPRNADAIAGFAAVWREQFDTFEAGDKIAHYRSRLRSGLVVNFMGRFFRRQNESKDNLHTYAVLYLVEVGGGQVQPIVAIVVPNNPDMGMMQFKEQAAYRGLAAPLETFLNSIELTSGTPPPATAPLFRPEEIIGDWTTGSSAYGGSYVNSVTGASAGIAYTTSGGSFRLGRDGTYDYNFAYVASSPVTGGSSGQSRHSGRYEIVGDTVVVTPSKPISYRFNCCAVGIGETVNPQGVRKRLLITVGTDASGVFHAPPLIPDWDSYAGTMNWYVEK